MIYFRNAMQSIPVDNRHCTKKSSMLKMHSSFLSSLLSSSLLLSLLDDDFLSVAVGGIARDDLARRWNA